MADHFIDNHDLNGVSAASCLARYCWQIHEVFANYRHLRADRITDYGAYFHSGAWQSDWQKIRAKRHDFINSSPFLPSRVESGH